MNKCVNINENVNESIIPNENISFLLDESSTQLNQNKNKNINLDLSTLLEEFDQMESPADSFDISFTNDQYLAEVDNYELNYTAKQLQQICEYYEIKLGKVKKTDLIQAIIVFEMQDENMETVINRHKFWSYMEELKADKFMKKFVIWN